MYYQPLCLQVYIGDSPLKIGENLIVRGVEFFLEKNSVKSGMFGQTANIGQRSCLFHTSIIGIKK